MSNNNHISECAFRTDLPAYLYDEIGKKEKTAFEAHLRECAVCTGELADSASALFSVREWRDAEFAHLKTPSISIPYEPANENLLDLNVPVSLAERLRQFISLSTAWATAGGIAVLVIGIGLFFALPNIFNSSEVAVVGIDYSTAVSTIKEPEAAQPNDPSSRNTIAEVSENLVPEMRDKNVEMRRIEPARENKTGAESKNASIKIRENARAEKTVKAYKQKVSNDERAISETIKKRAVPASRQIPVLSGFEEEEDNTLRLAELFEDVDAVK